MRAFEMVPVPALPAPQLLVKQWRSARGAETRSGYTARSLNKVRIAWGPQEAADLAGVAVRTASDWRRGRIVAPSYFDVDAGIVEGQTAYCSTDLLRLRLVADLRHAGFPTDRAESCSDNAYETWAYDPEAPCSLEDVLAIGDRWLLPADDQTLNQMRKELLSSLIVVGDPANDEDGWELDAFPNLNLVEYPIRKRVKELRLRVDAWWRKVGTSADRRPPWMK